MLPACPRCDALSDAAASECEECGAWLLAPLSLIEQLRDRIRVAHAASVDVEQQQVLSDVSS